MAVGRSRLQKLGFARETVPYTAQTDPAFIWRGNGGMLDDLTNVEKVAEMIGIYNGTDRTVTTSKSGQISLASTNMTFEMIQHLLVMALGGPSTGATDGTGTDKIYVTPLPTTLAPATQTYTIFGGDDRRVQKMRGAVCSKISITGAAKSPVKMDATLLGQDILSYGSLFSNSLPIPDVEDVSSNRSKIYIDPIGGTFGTTRVSNVVVGWKLDLTTKWEGQYTDDDSLAPTSYIMDDWEIKGQLTFLHDTDAIQADADWLAETPRLIRIDCVGKPLATAGTLYSAKHWIADLPCKYSKINPLGNTNGASMVQLDFWTAYNKTLGAAGQFTTVLDGVATLPG